MTKENCEIYGQEILSQSQDIMQKKVIEQKPFELPNDFYLESIVSLKPIPPQKPPRLKGGHNKKICSFSNQGQADIVVKTTGQECDKTFAEKKDFFEQLSNGYKPKGKVAIRVEQINQNGLNSNVNSKCKAVSIEEVQQICGLKGNLLNRLL